MFRLVSGGNGRTVYLGEVANCNESAMKITGKDWNPDSREEEEKSLQMFFDKSVRSVGKKLKLGDHVLVSYLPGKDEKTAGIAEEIATAGQVLALVNDRGNQKYVIYAKVHSKKWNEKKTLLRLNFLNLKDINGNLIGNPSSYKDSYGNARTSYWLSVNLFKPNDAVVNHYHADRADEEIEAGDTIMIVVTVKKNIYDGKEYTNYNGAKYVVLKKNAKKDASPAAQNPPAQNAASSKNSAPAANTAAYLGDDFDDVDMDDLPFN